MRPFQRDKRHSAKPSGSGNGAKAPVPPPAPAPIPAVPQLKKKEEDEKKRGAAWLGGSSGPGIAVRGAEMGAAAASRAGLLGSRAISAAVSKMFGGSATAVGAFFASKYGANLVLGGLLAWASLIGVAALSLFGRAPLPASVRRSVDLSMDGGGPLIDRPRDKSLGMVANANQGELTWEEQQKRDAAAKKEAEEQAADAPKEPETPQTPDVSELLGNMAQGGELGGDFTKKLAKEFGSGGSGGGMMAMGEKKGLGSGAGGFNLKSSFGNQARALNRSKMKAFAKARQALSARKMGSSRGTASRAMGQLKLARTMSTAGAASAPDTQARQYSANAFDQSATKGGEMAGIDPTGAVVPVGTGATGIDNSVPDAPTVPTGENVTPYQPNLDAAKNMGSQAGMMKMIAMMLLALGAILMAVGAALMYFHSTIWLGLIILGIGLALVAAGMAMMKAAAGMADAAKKQADQIQQQYGQEEQGQVVDECADQSYATGQSSDACRPATTTPQANPNSSVQQDVAEERNATYALEGERGEKVTTHTTQPK